MILIHEPDVALTDFGLAVECALFAGWLHRGVSGSLSRAFVAFFAAVAAASLLGGISHGFMTDQSALPARLIWQSTLVAIGLGAFASCVIGARLSLSEKAAARVTAFAGALLALYLVVVLFVSQSYGVAITFYLPGAIFLLAAFAIAYRRRPAGFLVAGLAGVALSFVAAAVQQVGIGLHPHYFDHNALYHLIQAFAFVLIFQAARGLQRTVEPQIV
jgi:hypothetical protein